MKNTQQQASRLRTYRKLHKYTGVFLAGAFVLMALSGILLAWKKNVEVLQPPSQRGQATELSEWKPLAVLATKAQQSLAVTPGAPENLAIDKMDARPSKGIVKVVFEEGYWEVQMDASTAHVLSVARRHSDWIEQLHDGSILTDWFKVSYSTLSGLALLTLTLSGLWLWYGPKKIRQAKAQQKAHKKTRHKAGV